MAYLFEAAVELGQSPQNASHLKSFDNVTWKLSDGTEIHCALDLGASNLWIAPNKNWWLRIAPEGVSVTGGTRKVNSDEMLVEVAKKIYASLKQCSGFRFAIVGWEVAESIEVTDLLSKADKADGIPPGVVISRELWEQMGAPSYFLPFGTETLWKPLDKTDYLDMVKLFADER